jgi:NADH dehydrogenase
MKIAITGGTGFVGGHFARLLAAKGHEPILIARGVDRRDTAIRTLAGASFYGIGTSDETKLADAFRGCDAIAHCAGINREIGKQTYTRVHVEGTRHIVNAARAARVKKIALLSFLRARPGCGSGYHESKFEAEEIVRASGLDYTILKCGVIYGSGDHMLDHLSHAFFSFPLFALVGMRDQLIRPTAVEDIGQILYAALLEDRLAHATIAVTGPEEMTLSEVVRRVAQVVGERPLMFRMPLWFHYMLALVLERTMTIPLVSEAQVRILSEGIVEALPPCPLPPADLQPSRRFTAAQIRAGLPPPKPFGLEDCRWFRGGSRHT